MSENSGVERTASTPNEIADMRPYQQLVKELGEVAKMNAENSFDIASQVIDQITTAGTIEEVFAANEGGPGDAENYVGQPIGIWSVSYLPVAEKFKKNSLGVYAVVEFFTREDEDSHMITVGASNVVASLRRLEHLGAITHEKDQPLWVVIRGRETGNGTLYTLHAAPR
jgi:hypothetical protein